MTTNGDDNPAVACTATTNQCATLRDAIAAANTDGGADTITFAPGVTGTITLTNGALPVTGAGGINASTISGNQGGANSFGGGLLVDGYVTGSLDVSDSTISGRSPPLP